MLLRPVSLAAALLSAATAQAQSDDSETLEALLACRDLAPGEARTACLEQELARFAEAVESGRIVVVERRALREQERAGFGLALPGLGALLSRDRGAVAQEEAFEDGSLARYGADGDLEELLGLPVQHVEQIRGKVRVTFANGQVWQQTDDRSIPPISRSRVEAGMTADIERGALGSHHIRLSGYESRRFRAERIR